MSSSNLKDIGLRLDNNSIFTIINYKDNDMHPILQAAITLVFFSQDAELRGECNGIYHLIGSTNNNVLQDIELDLAHISFAITAALQQTYPEVIKTDFETNINGSTLDIVLNITTTDSILSTTIFTKTL